MKEKKNRRIYCVPLSHCQCVGRHATRSHDWTDLAASVLVGDGVGCYSMPSTEFNNNIYSSRNTTIFFLIIYVKYILASCARFTMCNSNGEPSSTILYASMKQFCVCVRVVALC